MESKTCETCSTPVFPKNTYIECENSHITCSKCIVTTYKECPFCKADWKTRLLKENEIPIKVSAESDVNLDLSDCSSIIDCDGDLINDSENPEISMQNSISSNGVNANRLKDSGHLKANLLSLASGQSDSNKYYSFQFSNEKERKIFETMNSFSSEKEKLQVINVKSSRLLNNLPSRSPSHENKINFNFNELSSNEDQHFSPYQASPSTPPKNIRKQELSISSTELDTFETGTRRLKPTNTAALLLRQQARALFKTDEPKQNKSNENVFMVLGQPQKIVLRCSKMRRLRREQLIAEEKTMIRQRILQDMQQKLLEENCKIISNTSASSEGLVHTGHSIEGEDIKHESHREENFNKSRAKRNQEIKSKPNSSTSEFKSFYSEKHSSDMSSEKSSDPQVLQEELNLNFTTPKTSPRPSFKCMQQTTNNKDDLLKEFNSKCYLTLDTDTSLKTNSRTGSPSWEVTMLSPTSEKSYDKYGISKTVHHNYKDSSTEPIPSGDFEPHKVCCLCSCEKICSKKRIASKSCQTEIDDTWQKNSSYVVDTNNSKVNTNIVKNLKKKNSVEDLPSTTKAGKSVIINTNKESFNTTHLKTNEKSSSMNVKNNFDKTDKLIMGDYERVEKKLDTELVTFISAILKKNPKTTINNFNELFDFITGNDSIFQKNESKHTINTELKSSPNKIDTKVLRAEVSESNVFAVTNRLTNSWQAFSPSLSIPTKQNLEPTPQIRMIQINYVNDEIIRLQRPHSVVRLNINRNPLNCPITTCKSKVFISEFTKHIKLNHARTTTEKISPGVCKNLYIDCKLVRSGLSSCQILYLVTNKIRDFGNHEFRDFLPVLLMTTKASLRDLFCSNQKHKQLESVQNKQYYYFIWLTGFVIKEVPVYYTIIAWNRNSARKPGCHVVNAGKLHSFRESQSAQDLYKTGQALILSQDQCNILTDDGKHMLELQIILH